MPKPSLLLNKSTELRLGFNYVLILEWLRDGDERTGKELHAFLPTIGFPSKLVTCNSWQEMQDALTEAGERVSELGIPVVHLETHGSDPWEGSPENIGFGPEESGPAWSRLGTLLAPLNVAADFRLLCVSAACWRAAALSAIGHGDHPASFACMIGFRTEVGQGRLRDSMKELYRSIKAGKMLAECLVDAQNELVEGQQLSLEVAADLAAKILREAYFKENVELGPGRLTSARGMWGRWFPENVQARYPAYRFENVSLNTPPPKFDTSS